MQSRYMYGTYSVGESGPEVEKNSEEEPFMRTLHIISRKWTALTIVAIGNYKGARFNQLKKDLTGISSKTLSDTLRNLSAEGIVKSTRFLSPDMKVKYCLTQDGEELKEAIIPTLEWVYKKTDIDAPKALIGVLEGDGKKEGEKSESGSEMSYSR